MTNVLFLCTGNSARSILAESILRGSGGARFAAFSAGSAPKGEVNPRTLSILRAQGYPTRGLSSKGWTAFAGDGAPRMDIVITVCDDAAGEACPIWPGHPLSVHWGIPDPAAAQGSDIDKDRAFALAFERLRARIGALIELPVERLAAGELRRRLDAIGHLDGATARAAG